MATEANKQFFIEIMTRVGLQHGLNPITDWDKIVELASIEYKRIMTPLIKEAYEKEVEQLESMVEKIT